jgi:hypothetical protein
MNALILRLLPFTVAGLALLAASVQWKEPQWYPWPLLAWYSVYVVACITLSWKRLGILDAIEKMLPSALALLAMSLGFLIVEFDIQRWIMTIALGGLSLLVMELLFLLTRDGAKYPVNGLSRVNVTLVPVTTFFLASTLNALYVFLRWPWWSVLVGCTLLGAMAYGLTAHPTADRRHRRRWGWLGGAVGAHAGLLTALLPVSILVQGALAALLVAVPLRVRRYAYQPVPSRRHAWVEGGLSIVAFIALLATSRWA